jgi:hypothetical protein
MAHPSDSVTIDMAPLLATYNQIQHTMDQILATQTSTFDIVMQRLTNHFVASLNGTYYAQLQETREELMKTQKELLAVRSELDERKPRVRFSLEADCEYFRAPSPNAGPKTFTLRSPPVLPATTPDSPV